MERSTIKADQVKSLYTVDALTMLKWKITIKHYYLTFFYELIEPVVAVWMIKARWRLMALKPTWTLINGRH
uniref:CSON002462 protein n=1 Tax=Culicoides sonorensis TaxID=179676 RepID=A0A336K7D0_CULSO